MCNHLVPPMTHLIGLWRKQHLPPNKKEDWVQNQEFNTTIYSKSNHNPSSHCIIMIIHASRCVWCLGPHIPSMFGVSHLAHASWSHKGEDIFSNANIIISIFKKFRVGYKYVIIYLYLEKKNFLLKHFSSNHCVYILIPFHPN